ncbi:MAG: cupin domain-containing protein [Actinomycetota bacterium]|nr:cupin domain-containing protein [Actinomycetota bacterium]
MVTTSPWRRAAVALGAAGILLVSGCSGDSEATDASATASGASAPAGQQVLLDAQRLTVLDQQIVYPKKVPAQVTSSLIELQPGQETGWHRHNVPMYAYIMDGTLTVEYDAGVTNVYPAGTALMEAQGVFHNGTNKGEDPVRILVVYFGAKGAKNTVERAP